MTGKSDPSENRTLQAVLDRATQNEGPHPNPSVPKFKAPTGACDTHCHVFGPEDKYPYVGERFYTSPDAPMEMLFALHDRLGIDRAVIVHPSIHGTNNQASLDAMAQRPDRYRGTAMVDLDISDAELAALDAGGMRGIRFNFLKHLGGPPEDINAFARLIERIARLDWHLLMHLDSIQDIEKYADLLTGLPCPVVVDHLGRVPAGEGPEGKAWQLLIGLLANDNIWIKLSAVERVSASGHPFDDSVALAQALLAAAPEKAIWGTDWPHPNMGADGAPDDGHLVDILPLIAPDEALRQKLLVDN
ncbi:MAG: amidohydrolase family protein, partial [Rhodospirillales bacterium]|nr:amidohydrolase family protein [Rhodospirillales bacterium]